MDIVKQATNNM